jgi:hypothetical protein
MVFRGLYDLCWNSEERDNSGDQFLVSQGNTGAVIGERGRFWSRHLDGLLDLILLSVVLI